MAAPWWNQVQDHSRARAALGCAPRQQQVVPVMSGFSLLHLVSRSQPGALRPCGRPSGLWPRLECCCCVSMTSAAFSFRFFVR
ncbi:hypothetical protein D4764_22G0007430 [Takifugu flavidus]|uniref:Uncharacterized protein n=1 Tax=Takifugu flavidus TaxID=433684 RepID=A0A5C6NDF7_9TELE|nr:hypothetical protein D4764_22G0007430 [Takifugu flavidus]